MVNHSPQHDKSSLQQLLDALSDETNQQILSLLSEPMTPAELIDSSGLPSSTVYRKLDLLSGTGLIKEVQPADPTNRQSSLYKRHIQTISFSVNDEQLLITIERPGGNTDEERILVEG